MDSRSGTPQARPTVTDAAAALRAGVAPTRFGQVGWVAETGSTNRDLLDELRAATDPAVPDAVLVTDHQTAGRGTKGRTWFDPPGGSLLLSVRVRPQVSPSRLHLFTMALSLAAADACRRVAGVDVGLKWPNDLFVGERKLAGVLAESSVRGGQVAALVIGIGMNVNWPDAVPAELEEVAVALNQVAGRAIDRVELAIALVTELDRRIRGLDAEGGDVELLAHYRAASATVGRRVRLELGERTLFGEAVDVTDDGHLVVMVDGSRDPQVFAAADVTHLRLG